jgi:hypothetical protein
MNSAHRPQTTRIDGLPQKTVVRREPTVLIHGEYDTSLARQFHQSFTVIEIQDKGFLAKDMLSSTKSFMENGETFLRMGGNIDNLDCVVSQ